MNNYPHHRFFALLNPKPMKPEKHGAIRSRLLTFIALIFSLIFVPGMYIHAVPATSGGSPVRGAGFAFSQGGVAPTFTSAASATFTVGTSGSFSVTASGTPSPTISLNGGSPPSGLTFSGGVLSGTPAAGTGGVYHLHFTASNGVSPDADEDFTLNVDEAPSFTSANNTTFTVGALATFGVNASGYPVPTVQLTTGTLPTGVSFLVAVSPGSSLLTGTPAAGTGGSYTLHFTASNGVSPDATQTFTLNVGVAPAFTSAASTTFTVGTAGSFSVTASGTPSPTITLASGTASLPNGVTFSNGTLSGTPEAGAGGLYRLHFTASNGVSPDADEDFTLNVDEAPSLTSANTTTFTVGTLATFGVNTSGYPVPTVQLTTGTLPTGVSFLVAVSPGSSLLTGTPAAGTGGSYTLHFTASNGVSPDATQTFTLTVGVAPAFTSDNHTTMVVGEEGIFNFTASGYPAPQFTVSQGNLPAGFSLGLNGSLTGIPIVGSGGIYNVTIKAANGVSPDATQAFTLTMDEAPTFTSANHTTFTVGTFGTFNVTASGYPLPTVLLGNPGDLPSGVTFSNGVLSGTPATGTGGVYSNLTFVAPWPGSSTLQTFTLTVDEAPAFTSTNHTTMVVGEEGIFNFTASGYPAPQFAVSQGNLPAGFNLGLNGSLTGIPIFGSGGIYNVTIKAANGVSPDATQAFTLTMDEAPTFTSTNHTTFTVGTAGNFNVTASGYPPPTVLLGNPGDLPSGVTFSNGVLSGTPAAGTGGVYSTLTFIAPWVTTSVLQTFILTVDEAPTFTNGSSTTFAVGTSGTFNIAATGYPAPTVTLTNPNVLPNGVTFSSGTLSGTPATGTGGAYSLNFNASNGVGSGVIQPFTLTVTQPPAITTDPVSQTVCANQPVSFHAAASGYPAPAAQWQENGSNIGGATNTTLTFNAALSQNRYTFRAVFTNTATPPTATSQSATLTVNTVPTITGNPSDQNLILSQTATFTAAATNSTSVQWKVSSGVTFTNMSGATSPTLSFVPTLADSGHRYEAVFSNGCGSVTTTAATLTVRQIIITLSPAKLNTMKVGVPFSQTVIAAGGSTPYTYTLDGTLPPGLNFAAGVISGTPTAIGNFTFSVTAKDTTSPGGLYSATQTYSAKIDPPTVQLTPNSPLPNGKVGTAYTAIFTASGGTAPYTYTETGMLPAGMSFSGGSLSGTPTAAGTFSFSVTATDSTTGAGAPVSASKVYSLTIAP